MILKDFLREDSKILKPTQATSLEFNDIKNFMVQSGEVTMAGLENRLKKSKFLGLEYVDGVVAGVGAVKTPNRSYKERIFNSAGISQQHSQYDAELGWIFTSPQYRGKGVAKKLVNELLKKYSKKIFATVREDNNTMINILKSKGFKQIGEPYGSSLNPRNKIIIMSRG